MLKVIPKLFGGSNDKDINQLRQTLVKQVNALEPQFEKLSNEQLQQKTAELEEKMDKGASLDDIMPEAFANVREAAKRTLGQRHFDVQLIGGAVLHRGKVAEMRTGEGKTLVATLPAYLNALGGDGVHIVTVNDYLARRDAQWMGPIFHLLGISVACLQHDTAYLFDLTAEVADTRMKNLRAVPRREAYDADILYGTNSEFGFDYLRDNMVMDLSQAVQRPLNYAIVDEVDNILIDEARTPLIISGQSDESAQSYKQFAQLIPRLRETEDFVVDEKIRTATLTASGIGKLESALGIQNLYDEANYKMTHYVENALKAFAVYRRDREYVVKDGEVIIVDEFTGRLMPGRRYSDGLHQAIEAKEGVFVRPETVTMATITIQNYFRLYKKLSGMTGTAATEAEELFKIYKLDVLVIPTHREMIREDRNDYVYKTEDAKYEAVSKEIAELYKKQQPVLVGTTSIEKSERLSSLLTRKGIPHEVLNAKQHEREAAVVAQAGRLGAVTVATNMAGRGTDIVLGGSPEGISPEEWQKAHEQVVSLGGLRIIGTERHEARRIDNQLRGRAGRQGDPGSTRFYVSVDDDLMRRFNGDMIKKIMNLTGLPDDQPIEMGMVTKSIENAQTRVEGHNFDIRKHLLEYDDVVNKHREVIYGERHRILEGADLHNAITELVKKEVARIARQHLTNDDLESWDFEGLFAGLKTIFPLPANLNKETLSQMGRDEAVEALQDYVDKLSEQREAEFGPDNMRSLERLVMLRTTDVHWIEHLTTMENLRQGIGLQGVAQIDPLVAYKREGHQMFDELSARIQADIARTIFNVRITREGQQAAQGGQPARPQVSTSLSTTSAASSVTAVLTPAKEQKAMAAAVGQRNQVNVAAKLGRNDLCHCGSGKKFKKCHGAS